MSKNPIKCGICGRFISYKDFDNDKIISDFTSDTEYTTEKCEHYHETCLEKKKNSFRYYFLLSTKSKAVAE
jgi:hypothetical protein